MRIRVILLSHLRATQLLKQVNKRLIWSPGRVPKPHFTCSVRRKVGVTWPSIERCPNFPRCGNNQFGMQQPPVASSAATGCANRDLDFVSQGVRNLLERASQPKLRCRTRRMHSDSPQLMRDYQIWQQTTTPRYRVDNLKAFIPFLALSFDLRHDILFKSKRA